MKKILAVGIILAVLSAAFIGALVGIVLVSKNPQKEHVQKTIPKVTRAARFYLSSEGVLRDTVEQKDYMENAYGDEWLAAFRVVTGKWEVLDIVAIANLKLALNEDEAPSREDVPPWCNSQGAQIICRKDSDEIIHGMGSTESTKYIASLFSAEELLVKGAITSLAERHHLPSDALASHIAQNTPTSAKRDYKKVESYIYAFENSLFPSLVAATEQQQPEVHYTGRPPREPRGESSADRMTRQRRQQQEATAGMQRRLSR